MKQIYYPQSEFHKKIQSYFFQEMEIPSDFFRLTHERWTSSFKHDQAITQLQNTIEELQERLKNLEKQIDKTIIYKFRDISNKNALKDMTSFFKSIKKHQNKISVFEISQRLRLPADQVEEILEQLSKEKRVKFENGE